MEILLKIGSIFSLAFLPVLTQINKDISLIKEIKETGINTISDTSRKNLQIKVDSFHLDIIAPSLGVQFYRDGIVFLAWTKNTVKMVPEHISFGTPEAYFAIPGDSIIGKENLFSSDSTFSYPCDALTFSSDFKTMYFTRYSKTKGKEKIYKAVLTSGNSMKPAWSEKPEPLAFCNDNYNYSHPALSANGELMVFASNRKGSVGGMDLFVTKKDGESWSTPQNLGKEINTKGNELFPFLDSDNNLYFSSDGLPGLGGYDVFTCRFNGKSWDKPYNLTQVINSERDELAFTINKKDGKSGFFTTRQKSGKTGKQLFKISLTSSYEPDSLNNLTYAFYKNILNISDLTATRSQDSAELLKTIVSEAKKEIKVSDVPVKTTTDTNKQTKKTEPKITKPVVPKPAEVKPVEVKTVTTAEKQVVIYRIQFAATVKSMGSYKITINNKTYNTFEYFYKGAYRSTVGEFYTLSEASAFQNICRQSGYPNSFVAAFIGNERTLDPKLFK